MLVVVVELAQLAEVQGVREVAVLVHNIQLAVQLLVQQTLVAVAVVVLITHNQQWLAVQA
jgi:hypothetical protein